jgi:hypothetical protein
MTETSLMIVSKVSLWRRNYLIALYGLAALWGALQIVFPDSPGLYLILAVLFASTATSWARLDAMARSRPMLPVLQMIYFFVWPIGALVYLIAQSGWRGIGVWIMHGVGLFVTVAISFYGTFLALYFVGMLDG